MGVLSEPSAVADRCFVRTVRGSGWVFSSKHRTHLLPQTVLTKHPSATADGSDKAPICYRGRLRQYTVTAALPFQRRDQVRQLLRSQPLAEIGGHGGLTRRSNFADILLSDTPRHRR